MKKKNIRCAISSIEVRPAQRGAVPRCRHTRAPDGHGLAGKVRGKKGENCTVASFVFTGRGDRGAESFGRDCARKRAPPRIFRLGTCGATSGAFYFDEGRCSITLRSASRWAYDGVAKWAKMAAGWAHSAGVEAVRWKLPPHKR